MVSEIKSIFNWCSYQWKMNLRIPAAGSILYLLILPNVRGLCHLNVIQGMDCVRQSFSILGMILWIPVIGRERQEPFYELLGGKVISCQLVMLSRFFLASMILILELIVMLSILTTYGCEASFVTMFLSALWYCTLCGGVGFVTAYCTRNRVIGAFFGISVWYFVCF